MLKKSPIIFQRLVKIMAILIIALVGISIISVSINYFSPDFTRGYLSDKEEVFDGVFSIGFYTHITVAPILLLIGSFQVFRNKKSGRLHRDLGIIYVLGVILLGGPSGIILSYFAFGGIPGKINFLFLSLLWMYFTIMSYIEIRKGNIKNHQLNTISSYALLLSAILLRIFSFLAISCIDFEITPNTYTIISLLSWLPSLVLIRLIFRKQTNLRF